MACACEAVTSWLLEEGFAEHPEALEAFFDDAVQRIPEVLAQFDNPSVVDENGNGVPDFLDRTLVYVDGPLPALAGALEDSDHDGIENGLDADWLRAHPNYRGWPWDYDTDADGVPGPADWDDDGDGRPDFLEDSDGDGIVNLVDPFPVSSWDTDADGVPDVLDRDVDGDGAPDYAAPAAAAVPEGAFFSEEPLQPVWLEGTGSEGMLGLGTPVRFYGYWAVPVVLRTEESLAASAVQFSISLDSGSAVFVGVQPGKAVLQTAKQLHYVFTPREMRVLAAGYNRHTLGKSVVAIVLIGIEGSGGMGWMRLNGVRVSDGAGKVLTCVETESTSEGETSQKEPDPVLPPQGTGTGSGGSSPPTTRKKQAIPSWFPGTPSPKPRRTHPPPAAPPARRELLRPAMPPANHPFAACSDPGQPMLRPEPMRIVPSKPTGT